jgi:hypothetical protein
MKLFGLLFEHKQHKLKKFLNKELSFAYAWSTTADRPTKKRENPIYQKKRTMYRIVRKIRERG